MSIHLLQSPKECLPRSLPPVSDFYAGRIATQLVAASESRMRSRTWRRFAQLLFVVTLLAGVPALSPAIAHGIAPAIAKAQQNKILIKVLPGLTGRVVVEASCAPAKAWSFPDSYAGVLNLGRRVESFELFDANGAEISSRKIAPGQFQSATPASKYRYEVNLAPPLSTVDSAKVSWLKSEQGLLMLRDLLPALVPSTPLTKTDPAEERMTVRLDLPQGWVAHLNQPEHRIAEFEIADKDNAVIAVGSHLRISSTRPPG